MMIGAISGVFVEVAILFDDAFRHVVQWFELIFVQYGGKNPQLHDVMSCSATGLCRGDRPRFTAEIGLHLDVVSLAPLRDDVLQDRVCPRRKVIPQEQTQRGLSLRHAPEPRHAERRSASRRNGLEKTPAGYFWHGS